MESRGRADEDAALIAEHLEAAGDLRKAYERHMRAGGWATIRSIEAAHTSWSRARDLADRLAKAAEPDGMALRIAPRTLICGSAWRLGGSGAETGFDELRELCEATGDYFSLGLGMAGQVITLFTKTQRRAASQLADELSEVLAAANDPALRLEVTPLIIVAKLDSGEIHELIELADMAIRAAGDSHGGALLLPAPLALTVVLRGSVRLELGIGGWREDFDTALNLSPDDAVSQAGIHFYANTPAVLQGALTVDATTLAISAEVLTHAEQAGDNLALNLARTYRGMALIHAPDGDIQRVLELIQQVGDDARNDRYSRATLPPFECEFAREEARSGRLDHAVDRMRALVGHLHRTFGRAWTPRATRVLVDVLLQRGGLQDVAEAQTVADRFAKTAELEGSAIRDINLVRMRAQVSRAKGDEAGYREHRDRYRQMADGLGFEGHKQWAAAMP